MRCAFTDKSLSYHDLLAKANMCTLEMGRLKTLATEVFKIVNKLNPEYLSDIVSNRICT